MQCLTCAPRLLVGHGSYWMMLLSVLYQLLRCLLGLTAVLVRRDLKGCRTAGVAAPERRVAPTGLSGPLHARRLGVADCVVPAAAASPLGRDLPGDPCHDLGLAPPVGLAEVGLQRTPPAWTSCDRRGDQKHGCPHGCRESPLGTPAGAGELVRLGHQIADSTVWQIRHLGVRQSGITEVGRLDPCHRGQAEGQPRTDQKYGTSSSMSSKQLQ